MIEQSPYPGHVSSAKKVLLVCPVTLINVGLNDFHFLLIPESDVQNWKAEFYKWMGRDRINVVVCDKDVQVAQMFANV
jgi:DNA repair and recombination protein RAD54B